MSNYTGLLTGNYYFQLNTGNGFLEATYDQTIDIRTIDPYADYSRCYPQGFKRESVDNLIGGNETGLYAEFAVGADIFRIRKGSSDILPESSADCTRCILWDERNNFVVGGSATQPGIDVNTCTSTAIGSNNTITNSENASIIGGSNTVDGSYTSSIVGHDNILEGGSYNSIFGTTNLVCNSNCSKILGEYGVVENSTNAVLLGDSNTSLGGFANVAMGSNNTVCSQYGHFHASILGGAGNYVYGALNTIVGGQVSTIGAGAGQVNETYENFSLIGNGLCHYVLGSNSTIMNGVCNRVIGHQNFIGGGFKNCIDVTTYDLFNDPTVFNNIQDEIPRGNFIGNGYFNKILNKSTSSTVIGGSANRIDNSNFSIILNGGSNFISGANNSFILGRNSIINNYYNSISGDLFVPLQGVGIINDSTTPIVNVSKPRTLGLGFRYGTWHYPFINLNNDASPEVVNFTGEWDDSNKGFGGRTGEYNGYTGINIANQSGNSPWPFANTSKMISIGTNNDNRFHAIDISGFTTGTESGRLYRVYNPSVLIGSNNTPSHQNILIGVNNRSLYTAIEDLYTGLYGPGISGIRIPNVKTLNKGPWPIMNSTWPYYQGMNTLIGINNLVTGAAVTVLGMNNFAAQENAGPTLLLGAANYLLSESGSYTTGQDGIIKTFTTMTGPDYFPTWKKNTIILGFNNAERFGLWSNIIGTQNTAFSNSSNILGFDNNASGAFLNIVGKSNLTYGLNNSAFGTNNLVIDGQNNTAVGVNNIINQLHPNGVARPIDNNLFGNSNYVIGSNGLLLGLRNRFGYTTGVYLYDSILIGNNNISENSFTTSVGLYNYTTGFYSSTFGSNNQISGGSYNGIFGSNNVNFGTNSYSIGSNNKVYNEGGMALGNQAFSYNRNQVSIAGGSNGTSWPGSSQKTHLFWKGITSGVANTELMLDGVFSDGTYVSGKAFIPSGVIWNGTVNIIASETGLNNALIQTRLVSAANRAGTMHLINNSVLSSNITGTAAWSLQVSMDSTYKALKMTASGAASKVLYWSVIGEFNEAFIPTSEAITVNRYINNTIVGQALQGTPDISPSTVEATYPKSPNRPQMGQGSYLPS